MSLTHPATSAPSIRSSDGSRARLPDAYGHVVVDGVRIAWEVHGSGEPTVVLVPTWTIVHSRIWKSQIAYLARHFRVVTLDPRGNGSSDRPHDPAAYDETRFADDLRAVMDVTGTDRAVLVSLSLGAQRSLLFADAHPHLVQGLVFIAPSIPLGPRPAGRDTSFEDPPATLEGWNLYNQHVWRSEYERFLEFFFEMCLSEPHSTKAREDSVGWGLDTDPETLIASHLGTGMTAEDVLAIGGRITCPTMVIQGSDDRVTGPERGGALARAIPGARLEGIAGGGHIPNARDPVRVNLLIEEFAARLRPAPSGPVRHWTRSLARRRRALYISSPIGLGHAMRDLAIARELRALRPDLEIDWLAQDPVTAVLKTHRERIHPLSAALASESGHITAESSGHDLNAFQAIRRMDEILVANFMVFHDAVTAGDYDLVVGDEAWDVDHFLHENPDLKRTAFAWMTDFVGWLPMASGGEREAFLTADYNAEMIEHVERFPYLRDRAVFVGDPDDIVPDDFGPGLPGIREWTERHYAFSGYVTGFDPTPLVECREELRGRLGYHPDERVVLVTVGGSGVGEALLGRVLAAYPEARRRVNGLRMVAVAGPRIDPSSLDAPPGVEVRPFVPDLYEHLAASDLAVVQGGLTTTMELTAARRPFLYFPLRDHFEQTRHVRHRLDRYGAGRAMDFETATPDRIADAIAREVDRPVDYLPVARDGAARAASLIAELL